MTVSKTVLTVGMLTAALSATAWSQVTNKPTPAPTKATTPPPAAPAKPAAADAKAPAMPTMEDMAKMSAPGENQKLLGEMIGQWECVTKFRMTADAPWTESKGSSFGQMWYDGRYLHETFKGEMMGQEFKGLGITGYNNVTKKFEATWIDSMSTGVILLTGSYDAKAKSFTMSGQCADPMDGKVKTMREVIKMNSADNHVAEFFGPGPDGKEFKSMEISYTRKAKDSKDASEAKPEKAAKPAAEKKSGGK